MESDESTPIKPKEAEPEIEEWNWCLEKIKLSLL